MKVQNRTSKSRTIPLHAQSLERFVYPHIICEVICLSGRSLERPPKVAFVSIGLICGISAQEPLPGAEVGLVVNLSSIGWAIHRESIFAILSLCETF
jgi:hypothetical protein